MTDTHDTNLPEKPVELEEEKKAAEVSEPATTETPAEEIVSEKPVEPVQKLTKEEILAKLKEVVADVENVAKPEIDGLKQSFYKLHNAEQDAARKLFIENGGAAENFVPQTDCVEEEFKNIMSVIKEKRSALTAELEKQKEMNLQVKLSIIEELKELVESPDDANKSYTEFKKLQQQWNEVKLVPQAKVNELWKNYQLYVEKFYDLLKLNNEFREYDFKKNLEMKTALCETVEKLQTEPDVISAFHQLQKLHQQWREIGPVAKELREDLWSRFKAASTIINKRHQEHFEGLKAKEQENLEAKTAICEQIENIDFPALKSFKDWEEKNKEVIALQDMGHKRLAIEAGEDPLHNPIEYILESIRTIYGIKHKNGAIRRVNVNIAATTVENYRRLKEAGIGTYILFQETYHKESYETLHPTGPKHNYAYHTEAMDRAMEGGIDDVGLGVLFGLELYRYEFAGLLMHAEHLEAVHGVGPHTISVPRIKHADDIDPSAFDNSISDEIFAKICALIRIAVPYTGMIISTRESKAVREKVLPLGVSQISGASRTSVGGYDVPETEDEVTSAQFDVSDQRSLDEIVNWLMGMGDIPSFCTACYRAGRTGDRFMSLCKSKQISNCCHPNALMTLMEYLQDYASPETKKVGLELIQKELENIPGEKIRKLTEEHLADIVNGQRDFRF